MIARRAFLRGLALLGAAPALGHSATTLGGAAPGLAGQMLPLPQEVPPEVAEGVSPVYRAVRKLLRRKEQAYERRQCFKLNGFDADLLALRSISPAYRVYLQRKRDRERMTPILRLRERLGWL